MGVFRRTRWYAIRGSLRRWPAQARRRRRGSTRTDSGGGRGEHLGPGLVACAGKDWGQSAEAAAAKREGGKEGGRNGDTGPSDSKLNAGHLKDTAH